MNRITDVTRQDIIDIIRDGFYYPYDEPVYNGMIGEYEFGYDIKMPVYGRLNEIDFLSRIYDLDNMPSTDRRFSNARGDIIQHTVNNDDWGNYWYISDSRFQLSNGNDDEYLLRFICEMLHPAVRIETSNWEKYLEKFNEILEPDGYRLYSVKKISGRDAFVAREIDHVVISHNSDSLYANMKLIGEGSYAQVFKYTDDFYKKDFVVKRAFRNLTEKELERFKREFEEMQMLNSPYIVEVYSYNENPHEYTMEFMDCSLEKYISTHNSSMTLNERKNIIMQLLRAYGYLHSKGVFHRDISINNVLLKLYDDVIVVKISDFGLVKLADSDLTSENTEFKGSLNDPSLKTEGFGKYGLLHEIYAITLLFSYILTGKTNWAKITDPAVKAFMEKGTNPDKTKRYQTLEELGSSVKRCLTEMEATK